MLNIFLLKQKINIIDTLRKVNELELFIEEESGVRLALLFESVRNISTVTRIDKILNFVKTISKEENDQKEGKIKTSIVFVTKHVPGALYSVLKIFADAGINLSKIESRPRRKGRWEYIFLMDFEGDKDDPEINNILNKLNEIVIWYKILGSYSMTK